MLERDFLTPPDSCRGTDFWMLNDELEEGELRRQLRSMRDQGVASVIARTYIGLKSDYPGKDWMKKMHVVVDEAKKLGMTVFMQAGYMPEAVLGLPEEFSLGEVRACPAGQGQGRVLDSFNGVDYCLTSSRTILDMLSPEACAFYVKQSYEEMWKEFKDEYGKTIVSMWVDEPSFAKVALPWTHGLPAAYERLWSEAFPMEQLHLLFVDGPGDGFFRLKYWRTVLELMKNAYFKTVRDWGRANHIRFSGHLMEEDTMERQIRATCFTMPMYKYFDIPGIDYLTAEMDWVHGEIKPEKPFDERWSHYARYNTPLQCSSAAHQAGQKVILAEMYGVSTENLNLRDQKQMFDHFASLGINHRSVHGIFYSLRGRGKRAYPPHVSDYQPYWPKYHLLTDALARESAFLRAGEPARDVLLLHPMETAFSLYRARNERGVQHNPELGCADAAFNQTILALMGMGANFELGDEDTIAEMGAVDADGAFVVGKMRYRTVVLPDMRFIRRSTLALLQTFMSRGGRVVIYGKRPEFSDDGSALNEGALEGAQRADSTRGLEEYLKKAPQTYRFEARNGEAWVQIYAQRKGDERLFFLTNANCRERAAGSLVVPGQMECHCFEALDGSISPYSVRPEDGFTRVEVELEAGGSLMLRLRPGQGQTAVPSGPEVVLPLKPEWRVRREDPNALVLEMFRFARDGQAMSGQAYPILAIQDELLSQGFTGELTLETGFENKIPLENLRLALEYPKQQRLELDGVPLSNAPTGCYRCFAFETVALPRLEPGRHTLTIRRHFEPMRKPTSTVTSLFENLGGVDLEPMLILGDFAVRSAIEPGVRGCVRMSEDFVLTRETEWAGEELVSQGYPFYCGVMEMTCEIQLPEGAKEARLTLDGLLAAEAEVRLNGESCGEMTWAPYSVPLKNLRPGKNDLTLRLHGTLRNLLGPWHRPVGEIGACWAGYDAPNQPWQGCFAHEDGRTYPDWAQRRRPDKPGWTESYLLLPLGLAGAALRWKI